MHELSIANSIVANVLQEIDRRNLPPVKTRVVRIGALSSVVPEALQFNFEVITRDTLLANTTLEIDEAAVQGICHSCDHEFAVKKRLICKYELHNSNGIL